MDYEKKYKEAFEVAQKLYQDCPNGKNDRLYHTTDLEKMFPELRESEDEKIRKELIEHVKDQQSSFISAPDCRDKYEEEENDRYNSWIAWLEKQGESTEINPSEFDSHLNKLLKQFETLPKEELESSLTFYLNVVQNNGAYKEKQGEQEVNEPDWCHHKVDLSNCSEEYRKAYYDGWNNCNQQHSQCNAEQKPAWSEEDEKILNGIINELQANKNTAPSYDHPVYDKFIAWLKFLRPQKQWNKEDEKRVNSILRFITIDEKKAIAAFGYNTFEELRNDISWLKSLKERVLPKQEWSKEDNGMLDTMEGWLDTLCEYLKDSSSEYIPDVESCMNWLKSLRDRAQPKND